MKDGAHTHHSHGSGGLGLALSIATGLALADVIRAILPVLLIGLAVAAGLAVLGVVARVVTNSSCQNDSAVTGQAGYPQLPVGDEDQARAIARLRAELATTRASLATTPHQHLHFHGLDPAQVAAILAARQDQAADKDGDAW